MLVEQALAIMPTVPNMAVTWNPNFCISHSTPDNDPKIKNKIVKLIQQLHAILI